MDYINVNLNVNGFGVKARYLQKDVDELFLPLIRRLEGMRKRTLVYLAAPPGAGKTTLSLFLAQLSAKIQAVGIDGFHYPQSYIETHSVTVSGKTVPMRRVKGSPETYDIKKLADALSRLRHEDIRLPLYDRNLHDVVQDATLVRGEIVLVEGNWLLLDEPEWRDALPPCDYSIFISADEEMLKERLIQRKISGGSSPAAAEEFYRESDGANVVRALANRRECDCTLTLLKNGEYKLC